MSDNFDEAKCPEHEHINCMLAKNYPYCDMTCPVNTYAEQAYIYNTERNKNIKADKY